MDVIIGISAFADTTTFGISTIRFRDDDPHPFQGGSVLRIRFTSEGRQSHQVHNNNESPFSIRFSRGSKGVASFLYAPFQDAVLYQKINNNDTHQPRRFRDVTPQPSQHHGITTIFVFVAVSVNPYAGPSASCRSYNGRRQDR